MITKKIRDWGLLWVLLFSVAAFIMLLVTYNNLGLHRDEFLYLALGRHLATGYWSNPPLIGIIAGVSQLLPVNSFLAVRIISALCGALLVFMTGLITREFGGNKYARILACVSVMSSVVFLRAYSMFQPVPFDILFWTLTLYFFLRYVKTEKKTNLLLVGVFIGLGMLNKYMMVFLVTGLMLTTLITPYRRLWKEKFFWFAVAIAFVIFLPNLIWQIRHHFPVAFHMNELARTQLVHVNRADVLVEQLLLFFGSTIVWIGGLIWLLGYKSAHRFRIFGYVFLCIIVMIVILRGKSYYTAGLYPFYIAAGSVFWEQVAKKNILRIILTGIIIILNLPLVPGGIPVGSKTFLADYFKRMYERTGVDVLLRWENGKLHSLPQDYADRLGWDELGNVINNIYDTLACGDTLTVFCENYGQAGAVEYYAANRNLQVVSFSDSYILWVPDKVPEDKNTFLYINNELGSDVDSLFVRIDSVGSITDSFAREYGTTVFLLREPDAGFYQFWSDRVRSVKELLNQ